MYLSRFILHNLMIRLSRHLLFYSFNSSACFIELYVVPSVSKLLSYLGQMDYLETQKENFVECAARLAGLAGSSEDEEFKCELNKLLDQLNSCDYNLKLVADNQMGEKLLCHGAVIIPLQSEHLVTKFCPVIVHLIRKQNVLLGKETFPVLLEFLLKVIWHCSDWVHYYAFLALSTILFENCCNAEEFWNQLIGPQGVLVQSYKDQDVSRYVLKCIENLTLRTSLDTYLPADAALRCLNILVSHLQVEKPVENDEVLHCKILVNCLSGLQNVILGARLTEIPVLGELLALLKFFMFYNIAGNPRIPASRCLFPSTLSQHYFSIDATVKEPQELQATKSAPQSSKFRKRRTAAKKRSGRDSHDCASGDGPLLYKQLDGWGHGEGSPTRQDAGHLFGRFSWSKISSSESEHSDTEGGNIIRLHSAQSRVRQSALGTLSAIIKTVDRKIMVGYWSSFLPDAPTSIGTLASCLLKDPAPNVRIASVGVIICMLEGSKQFLSYADGREKAKTAFTSLSSTLASTLKELHRSLILAMVAEKSTLVLTQIIKCIAVLIQMAPVHKLAEGFLTKIARHLQPLLDHRDSNIRVAALTTFGCLLSVQPSMPEVLEILQSDFSSNGASNAVPSAGSWLIKVCLHNAVGTNADTSNGKAIPLPVRLESFQVLAAATKSYFASIKVTLSAIKNAIEFGLKDSEISVKLHSAKLLKELGCATSKEIDSSGAADGDAALKVWLVSLWINMLSTSLPGILQDSDHPNLQVEGCDCLSTISARIFESLPRHQQVLCETILLGMSVDPSKNVKATATRALGVFVLFPSLREDVSFVTDVSESVVAALEDVNLEVRLKSAWTLGNVTDALLLNKEAGEEDFVDELPDSLLLKLLDVALKASRDSDRIRSNGVRALGNLLRFLAVQQFEDERFKGVVRDSINSLVKCASTGGNMKVRWNACYALGNVLHNEVLNASFTEIRTSVIDTLARLAKDCKNFKVRINASAALGVPNKRELYGSPEMLTFLWQQLIASLWSIQSSMDFVEYQHHDHLVDQICSTLCHIISLFQEEDLFPLASEMVSSIDVLDIYLKRSISRTSMNKDTTDLLTKVEAAKQKLLDLKSEMKSNLETAEFLEKMLIALEIGSA